MNKIFKPSGTGEVRNDVAGKDNLIFTLAHVSFESKEPMMTAKQSDDRKKKFHNSYPDQ